MLSRYFCIVLLICVSLNSWADISEKRMLKIIRQCDVADTVMNAPDAASFWELLRMTNDGYRRAAKSLKGKGDLDIKRNLVEVLGNSSHYFTSVPTRSDTYDLMEALADSMGIRKANPITTFTVTKESDIALFGYPNGYIFMSEGLYNEIAPDTAVIRALLASEAAHYMLQHAYSHSKWEKSRKRRCKFWQIFGASAIAAGSIVADVATDSYFPAELGITVAGAIVTSPVTSRYTMHYTPMQIYEADIVAYRYMEWATGSGNSYIKALQKVGYDLDATSGFSGDDYPTVADRIAVLRYMRDNEGSRAHVKARKREVKPVEEYFDIFAPSHYK